MRFGQLFAAKYRILYNGYNGCASQKKSPKSLGGALSFKDIGRLVEETPNDFLH